MDQPKQRAGRKPGPKPRVTKQDLVDAALAIGIADFSVSQVASSLGMSHASLYRHVANRTELLTLCVDHIASHARWPTQHDTWQDVLRDNVDCTWEVCEQYPGLAHVMNTEPSTIIITRPQFEQNINYLCAHGFTPHQALVALDMVNDTALVSHIQVCMMRNVAPDSTKTGLESVQELFEQEQDSILGPGDPTVTWDTRTFLDRKIDIMILGLERWLASS